MSHRRLVLTGTCIGAVTAGLLIATAATEPEGTNRDEAAQSAVHRPLGAGSAPGPARPAPAPRGEGAGPAAGENRFGAFLGSGPEGVHRMKRLERWLGGREPKVGHTYLPGDLWVNIEGKPEFLRPWAKWRKAEKDRLFVLNVPMLEQNEAEVPDGRVDRLLRAGAEGRFDHHFRTLAENLMDLGLKDTVVVLGWEMNGTTYTHRCAPNPRAWKTYWQRIVTTMRAVPGQEFRFDFAPARGRDAIGWTECYPGDRYVDIIGMDSYDQPPGRTFEDQVNQPFGLQKHVDFAEAHGKPVSYPEWGLFRDGDNPQYMREMLEWIRRSDPVYHTITDYCPHGVMQCDGNPESSAVFRAAMAESPVNQDPQPGESPVEQDPQPEEEPQPGEPDWRLGRDLPWKPQPFGFCVGLGDWLTELMNDGPLCYRDGDEGSGWRD